MHILVNRRNGQVFVTPIEKSLVSRFSPVEAHQPTLVWQPSSGEVVWAVVLADFDAEVNPLAEAATASVGRDLAVAPAGVVTEGSSREPNVVDVAVGATFPDAMFFCCALVTGAGAGLVALGVEVRAVDAAFARNDSSPFWVCSLSLCMEPRVELSWLAMYEPDEIFGRSGVGSLASTRIPVKSSGIA